MHPVFYFTMGCAVLGAAGIVIAGKQAGAEVQRARWLEYFTWLIITVIIAATLFTQLFPLLCILIILAGYYEIIRAVIVSRHETFPLIITAIAGYTLVAAGFLFFSFVFNPHFIFSIYLQVFLFDLGAAVAGHFAGKRRPSSDISPFRRVEAVIAGFAVCTVTALIVSGMLNNSLLVSIFIGVLSATAAFSGDLLANWFRRRLAARSSRGWLPAYGGLLDRFDGFLFSGLVYYWLSITVLKELLEPFLVG